MKKSDIKDPFNNDHISHETIEETGLKALDILERRRMRQEYWDNWRQHADDLKMELKDKGDW